MFDVPSPGDRKVIHEGTLRGDAMLAVGMGEPLRLFGKARHTAAQ